MDKILKLYTYVDGGIIDTPFPNTDNPIEIGEFRYDAKRMGGAPTITASVNYPSCLDDEWTDNVYAEFNGEKYYLKQTPTSSYDNADTMYKHDITLVSERVALDNVYFFDVVTGNPMDSDKTVSNSTKVVFFGGVREFASRLQASLEYSGLGYTVVVDNDIETEEKLMSFEDQFFSNVLQEIYKTYEVPYYFDGKTIHIGYSKEGVVIPDLAYGVDNALLSITKNNANYKIVNRATGTGSSDNIPFYYPNNSPKGEVEITSTGSLSEEEIKIVDKDKFTLLQVGKEYTFKGDSLLNTIDGGVNVPSLLTSTPFENGVATVKKLYIEDKSVDIEVRYDLFFDTETISNIELSWELANQCNPIINMTPPLKNARGENQLEVKFENLIIKSSTYNRGGAYPTITEKHSYYDSVTYRKGQTSTGKTTNKNIDKGIKFSTPSLHGDVTIIVKLKLKTLGNFWSQVPDYYWGQDSNKKPYSDIVFNSTINTISTGGWKAEDGTSINMADYGIKFLKSPQYGDSFEYSIVEYVTPSDVLMPFKYRQTKGKERFYNATNDTYDGVTFNNPFVEGHPKEHIITVDDIMPSIEGMVNSMGLRMDMFSEFAYDLDDNDELVENEEGSEHEYVHSYFFAKLRKLDFNLFDHAIEQQPMTISFTSGDCGACNFEIGVTEEFPQKNPVQVNADGTLKRDEKGRVICGQFEEITEDECQPQQQDTINNEVWIALKKEDSTYGILMPKAPTKDEQGKEVGGHRPKACSVGKNDGDTFVILGINLPEEYIISAEKKLEAEIIKYLQENNDEKFTFSISFSRIYFEENATVLDQLSENSKIRIIYDEKPYDLYVSSFSYNMSEGDALPEIRVELDDTLKVSQNAIQSAISQVKSELGRAIGSIDVVGAASPYFIRKDADDEARGRINFTKGIKFGEGGKVEVMDNNSAKLTIEYLEVTKKASFTSLEIQEKTHAGGQILVTPASINCGEVEELDDVYRCYFQTKGADGDEIFNQFAVGDQAICQTYNAWGSVYYWRLVTGIGEDYIDLSKTDCDEDSGIPKAGDKIIQLGNRTDVERQNAIVIAAYGDGSPYIIQYKGINSFEIGDDKVVTKLSSTENIFTGKVHMEMGSDGVENLNLEIGGQNLLRNSGFTGDFVTESLDEKSVLDENDEMFSNPLRHWITEGNVAVIDSKASQSGKECRLLGSSLKQELMYPIIEGESYVLSFRARGRNLTYSVGGITKEIALTGKQARVIEKFTATSGGNMFAITNANATICEIQLERGNVVSAWGHSMWDNQSEIAKYQALNYLESAIKNGSTDILGGLIMSNIMLLGNPQAGDNTAGVSGIYNDDNDVAFWGGGTYSQAIETVMKYVEDPNYQPTDAEVASMAKAVITHGGRAILNDIIIRGIIYAKGGSFGDLKIGKYVNACGQADSEDSVFSESHHSRDGEQYSTQVKLSSGEISAFGYRSDENSCYAPNIFTVDVDKDIQKNSRNAIVYIDAPLEQSAIKIYRGDIINEYGCFRGFRAPTKVITWDIDVDTQSFNTIIADASFRNLDISVGGSFDGDWFEIYNVGEYQANLISDFNNINYKGNASNNLVIPSGAYARAIYNLESQSWYVILVTR